VNLRFDEGVLARLKVQQPVSKVHGWRKLECGVESAERVYSGFALQDPVATRILQLVFDLRLSGVEQIHIAASLSPTPNPSLT
jgi:hypothetical protein